MAIGDLPTAILGRTDLRVTKLGFGAMGLRDAEGAYLDESSVGALLNGVLDAGINYIDTSPDYGLSEERIGRHIASRRDEFFLASKCGCPVDPAPAGSPHLYTRQNVRAGVEQSLRRMRTDQLDLVQFHGNPTRAALAEHDAIAELEDMRSEGKVRFVGISGSLPKLPEQIEMGVFDAFQIPYSALERQHEELISTAAATGAGTIVRGGVARGAPPAACDDLLDGMEPMEFMLRFTISHPDMHTTIVGTSNLEHLRANVTAASKGPLPQELYDAAKHRL